MEYGNAVDMDESATIDILDLIWIEVHINPALAAILLNLHRNSHSPRMNFRIIALEVLIIGIGLITAHRHKDYGA